MASKIDPIISERDFLFLCPISTNGRLALSPPLRIFVTGTLWAVLCQSLGNRECLVYEDPDNKLYKSADNKILLQRLGTSVEALKRLPSYIENKQWSNVQSVLTGPMGSLSYTQNELVKLIDEGNPVKSQCRDLTGNIRKDLYAISAAIGTKDGKQALINYERASEKLEKFVKLVSSV